MPAKIAEAEVCNSKECTVSDLLVRGDQISFVSVEQAKIVGVHALDDKKMPSDVKLPNGYVLVHDTEEAIFGKCDFYVVKWHSSRRNLSNVHKDVIKTARAYFGNGPDISMGSVDVPKGPWKRIAKMRFIRYRRYAAKGLPKDYEHEYTPTVMLYSTQRPLAWKLALPSGCIVDDRGFVQP